MIMKRLLGGVEFVMLMQNKTVSKYCLALVQVYVFMVHFQSKKYHSHPFSEWIRC